jgi:hypothetical protein
MSEIYTEKIIKLVIFMDRKVARYFILVIFISISLILIFEMFAFIGIFCGIILSILYFVMKGILISKISYLFFSFSFLFFFLFLSRKKGRYLLLTMSIAFFLGGVIERISPYCSMYSSRLTNLREQKSIFEENFDIDIHKNWEVQNHSFPENGCEMYDSQIKLNNSVLTLLVDKNGQDKGKPYKGAEIGSKSSFLYGLFTVRMKNQIASGTVSSFFLMNKWKNETWEHKEIDIEFLGKNPNAVQFTVHHFTEGGSKHFYKEYTHLLGFNSADNYHDYSILWNKDSISWFVDSKWVYSEKDILIDEEMNIRLNHWAADTLRNKEIKNWLGPIDPSEFPSKVFYDIVKYSTMKSSVIK